jgi:hypothetical protein
MKSLGTSYHKLEVRNDALSSLKVEDIFVNSLKVGGL